MTIRTQLRTLAAASLLALAIVASPALQSDALAAGNQESGTSSVEAPTATASEGGDSQTTSSGHFAIGERTRLDSGSTPTQGSGGTKN